MSEDSRVVKLHTTRAKARECGGPARVAKQHAKGKFTPHERIEKLLDPGTFNELEPFITHQGDETGLAVEHFLGDGVVTGYGQINKRTVYLYAQDFTVY